MDSKTAIANVALARLSITPLASISENTDRAKKVRPVWDTTLATFLAEHEWSFAAAFAMPAKILLDSNKAYSYRNAFALPQDLIKLRKVTTADDRRLHMGMAVPDRRPVLFEVMRYDPERKQAIFTNADAIAVEYTTSAANLDDFSAEARDALACKLAVEIALNMKDATRRAQELIQRYEVALSRAMVNDSKTRSPRQLNGYDYTDARLI